MECTEVKYENNMVVVNFSYSKIKFKENTILQIKVGL